MKIRINGDTIRMRLTPEEVTSLVKTGSISDSCQFPNATLRYGISTSEEGTISARFTENHIGISVPANQLNDWDSDNRVGFEHKLDDRLLILIEKDFQCLHPRKHENEDHLYPNPTATK